MASTTPSPSADISHPPTLERARPVLPTHAETSTAASPRNYMDDRDIEKTLYSFSSSHPIKKPKAARPRVHRQATDGLPGSECPICLERKTALSELPCSHVFCTEYVDFVNTHWRQSTLTYILSDVSGKRLVCTIDVPCATRDPKCKMSEEYPCQVLCKTVVQLLKTFHAYHTLTSYEETVLYFSLFIDTHPRSYNSI